MPKSGLLKAGEALEPARVDGGTGSHMVLGKLIERDAHEVRDDLHPYAHGGFPRFSTATRTRAA